MFRQFFDLKTSKSEVYDFSIGNGLRNSKSKISGWAGIFSQSVQRDIFDSLNLDQVWWPNQFMSQPLGAGTKEYS